jgi:hypothetical protein
MDMMASSVHAVIAYNKKSRPSYGAGFISVP